MSAVRTVVIGGGIAGLAAAQRCAIRGDQVTVLERTQTVGGKLASHVVDGVTLDAGAESLLARRPEGLELIAAAGRHDDLVHPATSGAGLWLDQLYPLPKSQLLGIPCDVSDFDLLAVLGDSAVERVVHEPQLPPGGLTDMSVADLVGGQLGDRVVDLLVEPLLGGVYAGRADEISVEAAIPGLLAEVARCGSVVGAVAAMRSRSADGPVFASVVGGLGSLPQSLTRSGGVQVVTGTTVTRLEGADGKWAIGLGGAETIVAERVVVAVPGFAAARLLATVAPAASSAAAGLDYATVALVTAVFDTESVTADLLGTGFLVPPITGRVTKAATFVSRKWGWVADAAPGREVLRFSVGRHGDERGLELDDADLIRVVLDEVSQVLGLRGDPRATAVTRWERSLPQYRVGHRERVALARRSLPPGIAVAGAAWDGVGIPACIASGWTAADRVVTEDADG